MAARLFYGWVIAGVGWLAVLAGTPMGPTAFSVFIQPMSDDLGWSRTTISGALSLGTLAGAAAAPLAGVLVDRYGARAMLTLAGLGLGVSMLGIAVSASPIVFYLAYGLGRMIDMGVILVATTAALASWFVRRRGRAIGLAMMGGSVGLVVLVPVAQAIIERHGWRAAWLVFAAAVTCTLAPAAALAVRRRPENVGLPVSPSLPALSAEAHWTLRRALGTASFWLLTGATSLGLLAFAGVSTHQIPALVERGLSPATAAWVVSLHAAAWAVGNLAWGFVSERLPVRYSLALVYCLGVGAVLLLREARSVEIAVAYALVYGLMVGGLETVESVIWADYFGRSSLGAIRGFSRPFLLAGNALGTLLAGLAYDLTGGYGVALAVFAALLAVSAGLMLLARPPSA